MERVTWSSVSFALSLLKRLNFDGDISGRFHYWLVCCHLAKSHGSISYAQNLASLARDELAELVSPYMEEYLAAGRYVSLGRREIEDFNLIEAPVGYYDEDSDYQTRRNANPIVSCSFRDEQSSPFVAKCKRIVRDVFPEAFGEPLPTKGVTSVVMSSAKTEVMSCSQTIKRAFRWGEGAAPTELTVSAKISVLSALTPMKLVGESRLAELVAEPNETVSDSVSMAESLTNSVVGTESLTNSVVGTESLNKTVAEPLNKTEPPTEYRPPSPVIIYPKSLA